ncbi:hypothetical protein B0H14DRAFT_3483567 [Mycena olivaceomarginata]|nr:hypothetical protein B0H14DRAFT_3483567 [Mycena olivaceomarginata]
MVSLDSKAAEPHEAEQANEGGPAVLEADTPWVQVVVQGVPAEPLVDSLKSEQASFWEALGSTGNGPTEKRYQQPTHRGGKEGTGPRQKGKAKAKEAANAAVDDDGVWMAQVEANLESFKAEFTELGLGSSTAPVSAGCWLSDDDEDFLEAEEDGTISDAASVPTMEDLLATANDTSDTDSYEYTPSDLDGIEYFMRCLQGSDSDSDSDHESMPDLQAVSDSDSDCDSMPDLQCASDSEDEEDGESDAECSPNFFAYNSSDCECDIPRSTSPDGPDHPPPSFEEDIADWVEISVNEWLSNQMDTAEEKITSSFDTAMLANTPDVETEVSVELENPSNRSSGRVNS